jgi:hypothetical protein
MTMPGSSVTTSPHLTSPSLAFSLSRAGAFVLSGFHVLADAENDRSSLIPLQSETDRQQKNVRLGSINSAPAEL